MIYGYSRCSLDSERQDITRQEEALRKAGAIRIFSEYEHGDSPNKEQLSLLLDIDNEKKHKTPLVDMKLWSKSGVIIL